jgi:predicted Zn finger-like uncharacterized protein
MHIVCPHCTTSYAVNAATFGNAGRTVRCSRCKETWVAVPEELMRAEALATAAAGSSDADDDMSAWGVSGDDEADDSQDMPLIDSPSISSEIPSDSEDADPDWPALAQDDLDSRAEIVSSPSRLSRLRAPAWLPRLPALPKIPYLPHISLNVACAAMAALVLALMIWRTDVVRLLPQTASFYNLVGLDVNLRGLAIKDVKITSETVDGKQVLMIEGSIVSETRKPTELPRLRFVVRDEHGTEIYAWNAKLEQPGLNPGDKTWFRTRLASPPAEGRNIDVRFFNRRDMANGGA